MPTPRTLRGAWREMLDVWKRQQGEPDHQFETPLPASAGTGTGTGLATPSDEVETSIGELAPRGLQ